MPGMMNTSLLDAPRLKLNENNRHLIDQLTELTRRLSEFPMVILHHIEQWLLKEEEPVVYMELLDNIARNVPELKVAIQDVIIKLFVQIFERSGKEARLNLFKIRKTWLHLFSGATLKELDRLIRGLDSAWPKFSYATTDENQDNLMERLMKEGEELAAKQEMINRKLNKIGRQEEVGHQGESLMLSVENSSEGGTKRKHDDMEEAVSPSKKQCKLNDGRKRFVRPEFNPSQPIFSRFRDAWESGEGKLPVGNHSPLADDNTLSTPDSEAPVEDANASSNGEHGNQLWEQMSSGVSLQGNAIPGLDAEEETRDISLPECECEPIQPQEGVGPDMNQEVAEEPAPKEIEPERLSEEVTQPKQSEDDDVQDSDPEDSTIETDTADGEEEAPAKPEDVKPAEELLLGEEASQPCKPALSRNGGGIKVSILTKITKPPEVITIDDEEEDEISTPDYDKEAVLVLASKTKEEREAAKPRLVGKKLTIYSPRLIDAEQTGMCCIM